MKIAESVYILNRSGSTLSDQGGKTLSGSYTNKATPKSISSACNNGDIKYITLSYTV